MNNKIILASLAMDLRRVALGYHRGSKKMAKRFFEEALKRKSEIDQQALAPYIKILLQNFPSLLTQKEDKKIAEDALMYSTLFQNAAVQQNKI